jgi:hypothetical protein
MMEDARWRSIPLDGNGVGRPSGHAHSADEWNEAIVRTVAHLAAQLTVAQIRLRALASDLDERGLVEPATVAARVRTLAEQGGGRDAAGEPGRSAGRGDRP